MAGHTITSPTPRSGFLKTKCFLEIILVGTIWLFVLAMIPRGFDITDNGFYLMSYRQYQDVTAPFSMYDAVIKPIYEVTGGSTAATRLLGGVLLLAVSMITALVSIRFLNRDLSSEPLSPPVFRFAGIENGMIAPLLAVPVLYYASWLTTPSYNWLNLIGLMLFWTGLLLWLTARKPAISAVGVFLLALSFCLVLWAKVTSAVFLPLIAVGFLGLNYRRYRDLTSLRQIAFGLLGLAAGLLPPLLQGDTPLRVINKLQDGIILQSIKSSNYANIPGFLDGEITKSFGLLVPVVRYLADHRLLWILPLGIVLVVSVMARWRATTFSQALQNLVGGILAFGWMVNLVVALKRVQSYEGIGEWGVQIYGITLIFILAGMISSRIIPHHAAGERKRLLPSYMGWSLFAVMFNIVFSFGTSALYTTSTGMSVFFYLLGAAILLGAWRHPLARYMQTAIPITTLLAIGYILWMTAQTPYRQEISVLEMTTEAPLRFGKETVQVGPSMADYLFQLQHISSESGFTPGTPIIDLTGHSPGAVYALDGRAYIFPWLLGGYEGSDDLSQWVLGQWPEQELRRAWILIPEEKTQRSISVDVLNRIGLDFPEGYSKIGTVVMPYYQEAQALWKTRESSSD